MIEEIRWRLSLSRNSTLYEWMREQYTRADLEALAVEATDADLAQVYDPFANTYLDGGLPVLRKAVQRLYQRCGNEIWSACYRAAAGGRPTNGYDLYPNSLTAFGTLHMAIQVIEPRHLTFVATDRATGIRL
jgi:hypothetical protein